MKTKTFTDPRWTLQWRDRKGTLQERSFVTLEAAKTFGKTLPFRSVPFLEMPEDTFNEAR